MQGSLEEIEALNGKVLAISADDAGLARRTMREWGITFSLLPDPGLKALSLYGAWDFRVNGVIPSVFIIDHKGKIRYIYRGKHVGDRPDVRLLLTALKWIST